MAISDAYATAAEYRAATDKVDTSEDAAILTDLTAVSRMIELELGRFFNKDASDVARDFIAFASGPVYPEAENPWRWARGSKTLELGCDLATVTSVVVDDDGDGTPETTVTTGNYQLWPLNADKGPEARPYRALFIPEWSTRSAWPSSRIVRITGKFGWPAVPGAIKAATIQLTAILRIETPRAEARVSELGQLVQMSPKAMGIVHDLKRNYSRITL